MAFVYTYGSSTYTSGATTAGWQPHNYSYGGSITFAEAGDVDQLGVYCAKDPGAGDATVKIALYDTSGNLVKDGGSIVVSSTTQGWREPTAFAAVSVSATTYVILSSSSHIDLWYGYNSSFNGSFATDAYANFPTADVSATISVDDPGEVGFGRRANFTASGGGLSIPVAMNNYYRQRMQ